MEIVRTLIVSYLALTLGATGLAKITNLAPASVGMVREKVFSSRTALPIIFATSVAEIALAISLALGVFPKIAALGTIALFALFATYRLVVAIKHGAIICSCAGYVRTDPASPAAVAGAALACAFTAALAAATLFLGNPAGYPLSLVSLVAVAVPFTVAAVGLRRHGKADHTSSFSPRYLALGTEELFRSADLEPHGPHLELSRADLSGSK